MSETKKARRISIIIGLIIILVAALLIAVTVKTEHFTATVTEITDSYTTHSSSKRHRTKHYNEKVSVIFVNADGKKSEAKDVRVMRNSETQLPKVGDTIEVTDGFLGVKEFRTMTQLTTGGTLIAVGILWVIVSFRVGKKKKKDALPDEMIE